jgi:HlyD family secretion protein
VNEKTAKQMFDNSYKSSHSDRDPNIIRVLIVDDRDFTRRHLQLLLEPELDLEVVGIAGDGSTAIAQVESLQPDVVLIDLEMPEMDGIKATKIITQRFFNCKILVISSHENKECINQAMRAGAKGYLLKGTAAQELVGAIRSVYRGCSYLGPGLWSQINLAETKTDPEQEVKDSQKHEQKSKPGHSTKANQLFRKESLEKLASPERLDQLIRLVSKKGWLSLVSFGFLIVGAGVWSVYGSIPVTVEGKGVLVYPSKVLPLQANNQGQLQNLQIKTGERVKKGEVIATIDRVDLKQQLKLAQAKLEQLEEQNRDLNRLQTESSQSNLKAIAKKRQTIEQKLQISRRLIPTLKEKKLTSIQRDRATLQKRLKKMQQLLPTLARRPQVRQELLNKGAISDDTLLQARQEYLDHVTKIDEAESQLKQLDIKEADALKEYLSNLNEIQDIKSQIQELNGKQADLVRQDRETLTTRKREIKETEREITRLEEQISNNSQIVSQHTGKVLEITVNPGQVVESGTRIANIDLDDNSDRLVGVSFFPVEDGKKIKPEMAMQIVPQTIKRERFGGIVSKIERISSFPTTKEAAANVVGNQELVDGLVSQKQSGLIQVFASLQTDSKTPSGYQWSSSSGPNLQISPGTTTTVRVKVEERAPITYLIPLLRSVSGLY